MQGDWRKHAAKVIEQAIVSGQKLGLEDKALEKHVQAAYPYDERANHPYKIWCSEFNRQVKGVRPKPVANAVKPDPSQGSLFPQAPERSQP